MARFGLWVAALSLVCLFATVTASTTTANQPEEAVAPDDTVTQDDTDGQICTKFFDDGSKMSIARVFDMIAAQFLPFLPDFGTELVRAFMKEYDINRDDRLDLTECKNLLKFIKNRPPPTPKQRK